METTTATAVAAAVLHASESHGTSWVTGAFGGVGIPYLALLALTVLEGRGEWDTFARRFLQLGIDMCVLGIGVTGALFANEHVADHLGQSTTVAAMSVLLVDLILTGFALQLRSGPHVWGERQRAAIGVFLGVLILAINTSVVFLYS